MTACPECRLRLMEHRSLMARRSVSTTKQIVPQLIHEFTE